MLFWGIRASIPTKNFENKTVCVFFHCAFDGNAPGRRNIPQKLKNNEKLDLKRSDFSKPMNKIPIYILTMLPNVLCPFASNGIFAIICQD